MSTLHVIAFDGVPTPGKIVAIEDRLAIQRQLVESGRLAISWPVASRGEWVLSTGTLIPRPVPYPLLPELARGTVNRARNQISLWEEGGLEISGEIHELISDALAQLNESLLGERQQDACGQRAIDLSIDAIDRICKQFSAEVLPIRNRQPNLARVKFGVRQLSSDGRCPFVEWDPTVPTGTESRSEPARSIVVGPILDAAPEGLGQAFREIDGFDDRRLAILNHASAIFSDLSPQTGMIHVVAGLNGTGHRWMSYPQQLQLSVDLLQMAEDKAPGLPAMVSMDAPWAERLAWSVGGSGPLSIADTLLRRGLNIAAFGLDIRLDYWPGGTLLRDPLQWLELVDTWSQLGLPIIVNIEAPSGVQVGPIDEDRISDSNGIRHSASDEQRLELISAALPVIASRPAVEGIIWSQARDGDDPRFPYGGLATATEQAKPVFKIWQQLVQQIG